MPEDANNRFADVPDRLFTRRLTAHLEEPCTIEGMTYSHHYQSPTFQERYLALRDGRTVNETQPIVFKRTKANEPNSSAAQAPEAAR